MMASTSTTVAGAVLDEDALTSDHEAEVGLAVGMEGRVVPDAAASAWPLILDQIFEKMLMDARCLNK